MRLRTIVQRPASRIALAVAAVAIALASWFAFRSPEIDLAVAGTARRPIVVVNGKVEQMPAGDYLAANTLVDTTGCSDTNVIKWNAGTSQFACGAGGGGSGGGITNSAGANVMMKSDGTNAVTSGLSDDGTAIITARKLQIGATAVPTSNKAWIQQQDINTTTQWWFQEDDTGHVGSAGNNESIPIVIRNYTGFAMGAGGVANGSTLDLDVNVSKTSGTGTLTSRGITVLARGGDQNYAIDASAGIIRVVDGITTGPVTITGDSTSTGGLTLGTSLLVGTTLQTNGAVTLGTSGAGAAHSVNGTIAMRSSNPDVWLELVNNASGGRAFYLESSGTSGTQPNTLNIYDNTAALVRWYIDNNGTMTVAGGHYRTTGTAPTLSSCGTSPAITGTDAAGVITTGSAATTCTITFALTYTTEPPCVVVPMGTATMPVYTVSATAITIATDIASTKYHYWCPGL